MDKNPINRTLLKSVTITHLWPNITLLPSALQRPMKPRQSTVWRIIFLMVSVCSVPSWISSCGASRKTCSYVCSPLGPCLCVWVLSLCLQLLVRLPCAWNLKWRYKIDNNGFYVSAIETHQSISTRFFEGCTPPLLSAMYISPLPTLPPSSTTIQERIYVIKRIFFKTRKKILIIRLWAAFWLGEKEVSI